MFIIDTQTKSDLSIFTRMDGLCDLFDTTKTVGGSRFLSGLFNSPLSSLDEITTRQEEIQLVSNIDFGKTLDKFMFDDLERYLRSSNVSFSGRQKNVYLHNLLIRLQSLRYQEERILISRSVSEIANLIIFLNNYFGQMLAERKDFSNGLVDRCKKITTNFNLAEISQLVSGKIPLKLLVKYDSIFRDSHKQITKGILEIFYELDALYAVGLSIPRMNLTFPKFENNGERLCNLKGCHNPYLTNPVKNDVYVERRNNIWFLTGANMTGKSTLLKTIGIAIYLAHMGFPVPAEQMNTVHFTGLVTSINLKDDIEKGHSHFFSEIFRLKYIAETLQNNGRLVVIIDELFKGTNYDDAYQATIKVLEKLANYTDSIFIISSHLTDVTDELDKSRIDLKYLVTNVSQDTGIKFTYQLGTGVSKQKLGLWLLEKENVLSLLDR